MYKISKINKGRGADKKKEVNKEKYTINKKRKIKRGGDTRALSQTSQLKIKMD